MSYKGLSSAQIFTYEQVKEINNEIKKNISGERDSASKTATKKGKFFNVPVQPLIDLTFPWLCQCQEANRKILPIALNSGNVCPKNGIIKHP